MHPNERPVGVIDSGVGGLTVARRLRRLLPGEDIIYVGDSANVPYGNRSADEIFALTMRMLRFLEARRAKCAVVACNTISTIAPRLRDACALPLVDIVSCSAEHIVHENLRRVGLLATEFTAASGVYDAQLRALGSDCEVVSQGSPTLAALIDRGDFDGAAIDAEIRKQVGAILSRADVEHLMLACTHFPIVEDAFRACFPQLRLIDPAERQADAVKALLAAHGWLAPRERGTRAHCTTGDPAVYAAVSERLGLGAPDVCETVTL